MIRAGAGLLFLALLLPPAAPVAGADTSCSSGSFDQRARIAGVIDGDTVILEDGAHLRLVGIDTPELGRDDAPDQAGAQAARRFLLDRLPPGTAVGLGFDAERRDRHGRLLAHAFAGDGANLQAAILAAGLAVPLTVPPNLRFLACYRAAARQAEQENRGLWALPGYQPLRAAALDPGARGYRVLQGIVSRQGESTSSLWLDLDGVVGLRIVREDLRHFGDLSPRSLRGAWVEARGMVYRQRGQLRMRIRHAADLSRLPDRPQDQ